jgi:hypothetical protein
MRNFVKEIKSSENTVIKLCVKDISDSWILA